MPISKKEALDYHLGTRPGKIEVVPTKPCRTQWDLSLAYTPGVAEPCLEIQRNPRDCLRIHRARQPGGGGHHNGTAVLGLGNIGALAGKPVMEGKGVLFKRFADIDVFDLEVGIRGSRRSHQVLPVLGTHLRRHQSGGHQGAGMLLHRGNTAEDHVDPGLPRRPARDGHHLRRGAAERLGGGGQRNRQGARGLQRRGRRGHRLRGALRPVGREARKYHPLRHQGRDLRGPRRGHESLQAALRRKTAARTLAEVVEGADVFVGFQ